MTLHFTVALPGGPLPSGGHAGLEGESLWEDGRNFVLVEACRGTEGLEGPACREWTDSSVKARLQWELERALARFEARYGAP